MWLARTFLQIGVLHFVDDFGAIEDKDTITSSFEFVHKFWERLGFRFKSSKKQEPSTTHKIQGVVMDIKPDHFVLATDPDRVAKITNRLHEIILQDALDDEEAQKIAGKLQFMSATMSGAAMKSCLQPIYGRACQRGCSRLSPALQDAIQTIIHLLRHQQPRIMSFEHQAPAVLFADAYFQAGDKKIRVSQATADDVDSNATNLLKNGWGFVLHLPSGQTVYGHGSVPGALMGRFTSRGGFIYALEILAQIMAIVICQDLLPDVLWAWIDNTAGQAALTKGYGKDRKVNRLLTILWNFLAHRNIEPFWRRVTSSANISDSISREDFSIAENMQWTKIDGDFDSIYHTLITGLTSFDAALKASLKLQQHGCSSLESLRRTTMEKNDSGVRPTAAEDPKSEAAVSVSSVCRTEVF